LLGKSCLKLFIVSCIFASVLDFAGLVHFILVSDHVTFRDSTLNTANLCPAISVVGLFYLLTVMYTFVWFGTLVHFRWTVHSKL